MTGSDAVVLVAEQRTGSPCPARSSGRGGGRPSQRAASTRRKCALEKSSTSPVDGAHARDHAIRARADLLRRLAARTAVAEELPVRALRVDLGRGAPLVVAVVPLDEVGVDVGAVAEARQLAGSARALQRAA